MKSYFASYRPYRSGHDVEATVLVFDKNLNIGYRDENGHNQMVNWLLNEFEVSYDFPLQQSRIRHKDGSELFIEGKDAADFISSLKADQKQPWHKRKSGREWIRNSSLILGFLGALFILYLLLVPWLSQQLAGKVSIKTERQLGDGVYNVLALTQQEDSVKTILINQFFRALKIETPYDIRISVIKDEVTNAFALPGGRIVVYTALLNELKTYPELAALLSHEFTHVNNRHATKSIFRRLGSKIFLSLLFGNLSSVTGIVIDNADNLRSLKYSRRLEKEADMDGLSILVKRNIDPRGFERLFNHLKNAGYQHSVPEFLASHPDVNKRIRYINESAGGAVVKENEELKAIFEKLK